MKRVWGCAVLLCLSTVACSGDEAGAGACGTSSERLVVTADWLNRTLSLLDAAALADPACGVEDALSATIDLAAYAPGPLELELTPQGEAVVAVGPGFLAGTTVNVDRIEPGGVVLVVDLDARSVRHVIEVPHAPMGLAITPDGRYALSANYGEPNVVGNTLTLIDLDSGMALSSVEVGDRPEQVVLDAQGDHGIVNSAADNVVHGFSFASGVITVGQPLDVPDDPSDVAYVTDDRAVVTSSLGLSYSLIDTGEPLAPTVLETFGTPSGVPYGASLIEGTTEMLITTFLAELSLLHVDLANDDQAVIATIALEGSPLSLVAAHDATSGMVFVPQPGDQLLTIVDLAAQTSRRVTWLADTGPTYAVVRP